MANRSPSLDELVFSIADLKIYGNKKLPKQYRDFYNDGAMDMVTDDRLCANEEAFDRLYIRPRVLRNVSQIDTTLNLFGQTVRMPLGLSPSAMQSLAHPEGELATSRAAAKLGVPMCLSSYATTSLEDVIAQSDHNPYMMQICAVKDRSITLQLLKRAEDAGYRALFFSVDVPVLGRRLNEMRNNLVLPPGLSFPNILSAGKDEFGSEEVKENGPLAYDDTLEWCEIIPWLRNNTKMEIWLKGVTTPADVQLAIDHGVDGIIVSNHGGRQLDGMPATLDLLRDCVPLARGRIQLAMDGGIRRGSDIFKALALGAQFVLVGRIPIWGLAYKGQEGVELGIKILLHELRITMALAGAKLF